MAEGSARTKLATVALVIVGFALGFAEFIVIGITPDIAEEYGISLASAGNLVGFFAYFICGVDADHCAFYRAFSQVSLVRDVPCGIQRRQPSGHRGSYV